LGAIINIIKKSSKFSSEILNLANFYKNFHLARNLHGVKNPLIGAKPTLNGQGVLGTV
jgi:hypothetical protein